VDDEYLDGVIAYAKDSSKSHQQKVAFLGRNLGLFGLVEFGCGIFGTVIDVTPKMAAHWLEANTNNRRPKDRSIKKYAGDMRTQLYRAYS